MATTTMMVQCSRCTGAAIVELDTLDKCSLCSNVRYTCPGCNTSVLCLDCMIAPKMCRCKKLIHRKKSRSKKNEGRIYFGCFDCNFFEWVS